MKSFGYAVRGIARALKTERNLRIHFAAVFYVAAAGIFFGIERWAWAAVVLACGLVIGAELLNTAVERLCDTVAPGRSPAIGAVKDITAGAVLACAIAAVSVAAVVFYGREWPEDMQPVFWAAVAAAPVWVWICLMGKKR